MMKLGGNITLDGFENLEPAMLVVVKKMVGIYAKRFSETLGSVDSLEVVRSENSISVRLTSKEKTFEENANDNNLFVTLSKALTNLANKIKG